MTRRVAAAIIIVDGVVDDADAVATVVDVAVAVVVGDDDDDDDMRMAVAEREYLSVVSLGSWTTPGFQCCALGVRCHPPDLRPE